MCAIRCALGMFFQRFFPPLRLNSSCVTRGGFLLRDSGKVRSKGLDDENFNQPTVSSTRNFDVAVMLWATINVPCVHRFGDRIVVHGPDAYLTCEAACKNKLLLFCRIARYKR